MKPEGEVIVRLRLDEWIAMTIKLSAESHTLSTATRAAVSSEAPTEPGLLRGVGLVRRFRCSSESARELLRWCEAAAENDPEHALILKEAARSISYAMWRRGEGPPPDSPA